MARAPLLAPENKSLALALLLLEENEDAEPSEDELRRCERERPCGERGRMGGGPGMDENDMGVVALGDEDVEVVGEESALSDTVCGSDSGNGGDDSAGCV
jgi:hypothetical protein